MSNGGSSAGAGIDPRFDITGDHPQVPGAEALPGSRFHPAGREPVSKGGQD